MFKKSWRYFLTVSWLLLILVWSINVQAAAAPLKKTGYTDFSSWYINTYHLKELPFRAAALIDANTLQPLYYYQETTVMPTASLMKLLTAGAFLSYGQPDWYKMVNLTEEDNETLLRPYTGPHDNLALLRLKNNETITLEQAFATMLIASANNIAVALPRYAEQTRTNFIARMQTIAEQWGMLNTHVDEPSGLSLNNLSNAQDLALAGCHAFSQFMINHYASSPSFSYTTSLGSNKNIWHTVHDLRQHPLNYFGGKTGYLNETQYHLVAGLTTADGHKVCAAILTSPTRTVSEQTAEALRLWADKMYQW